MLKAARLAADIALVPDRSQENAQRSSDASERYKLKVNVGIMSEGGQSRGRVQDISVTGARIEGVDQLPEEGEELRLGFSFTARALPVPIRGRVIRHTESGGFAVEFADLDFRTRILLGALLPTVGTEARVSDRATLAASGHLEAQLPPELVQACANRADARGMRLEDWIVEQLERAAYEALEKAETAPEL